MIYYVICCCYIAVLLFCLTCMGCRSNSLSSFFLSRGAKIALYLSFICPFQFFLYSPLLVFGESRSYFIHSFGGPNFSLNLAKFCSKQNKRSSNISFAKSVFLVAGRNLKIGTNIVHLTLLRLFSRFSENRFFGPIFDPKLVEKRCCRP